MSVVRSAQVVVTAIVMFLSDACGTADAPKSARAEPFSFATVDALARANAAKAKPASAPALPEPLAGLSYDQYRDIRYRPARALWHSRALFEVQFFHLGFNFKRRVNVSEISEEGVKRVAYDASLFDFGPLIKPMKLSPDLGFAGMRVHFPLHNPQYKDELIVFLGASYFRVLGRDQTYGLSARGLAIDAATAEGEEFPYFSDFWLVRPKPEDRVLTVFALLESESISGAYRFDIKPGGTTKVEVSSRLYPRTRIAKLGVAPLSSMFLYGEDPSGRRFDDFRPEVHDSDVLTVQTGGGEWIGRPLVNPRELRVNRFMDDNPRGFGLQQRDRRFSHYEDNESRFERRPSYWIEPIGNWGKGGVELLEIPTDEEIHDNIAAYWVPERPVEKGSPLEFNYRISAYTKSYNLPPAGKAIATRIGTAAVPGDKSAVPAGMRRVIVDFVGGELEGLHGSQPIKAHMTANGATIDALTVERMPESSIWRAAFRVLPTGGNSVDLRGYLSLYDEALTETWAYQWTPQK